MKNLFLFFGLFISFLFGSPRLQAQDPYFSQFFANRIYLNPAYAGFDPGVTLTLNYRDQWFGVPDGGILPFKDGFRTYNATVDWQLPCFNKLENNTFGLALSAFRDDAGAAPLSTTGFGFTSAMGLRLIGPKNHRSGLGKIIPKSLKRLDMRMGFQFSLAERKLDSDWLIYSYQLDPVAGLLDDPSFMTIRSSWYGNFNAGVLLRGSFSKKTSQTLFTLGLSLNNVAEPEISLKDFASDVILPMRTTLYVSTTHRIFSFVGPSNKYWYISPQFRWDRQMDGKLNLQTVGFYGINKMHAAGVFVQYNFPNTPVTNSGVTGPLRARNTTMLIFNYSIDLYTAIKRSSRDSGVLLGLTVDVPVGGVGIETATAVLEFNLRINLWQFKGRNTSCLGLTKMELYNNRPLPCPWRY